VAVLVIGMDVFPNSHAIRKLRTTEANFGEGAKIITNAPITKLPNILGFAELISPTFAKTQKSPAVPTITPSVSLKKNGNCFIYSSRLIYEFRASPPLQGEG
jgi:hypothetical protein